MILGAVLAGGRSSRFGSDKAAALLGGEPLYARAAALIAPYSAEVIVVGGPPRHGFVTVPDRPAPDLGPLGGVAGALAHAAACGFSGVLTLACDTPDAPHGLLDALVRRGPSYCQDAPTLGFWPVDLASGLLDRLNVGGERSLRGWARSVGAIPLPADGPVANVNTPVDLATLDALERSPA